MDVIGPSSREPFVAMINLLLCFIYLRDKTPKINVLISVQTIVLQNSLKTYNILKKANISSHQLIMDPIIVALPPHTVFKQSF